MGKPSLQPIRGFRDIYPQDMVIQYHLFGTLKKVANLMGFEPYDGPLLEPIELYLNKTSEELINRQSYQVKTKDGETLIMRPEMTPSLARMIAARAPELTFPLKLFNLGLRYRYEAPQKGRLREFIQADFDILGSESILADAEILVAAIQIMLTFGAVQNDFKVYINSRKFMEGKLGDLGIKEKNVREMLTKIDRRDKSKQDLPKEVEELLETKVKPEDNKYFQELFSILKNYGVDQYCEIDLSVVRGLDYYTGLVFEVKKNQTEGRSTIIGGGRYDNLVGDLNPKLKIAGVGFAVSDVILKEFITDNNLLPGDLKTKQTKCLVTVFSEDTVLDSIKILNDLRGTNIASEVYLGIDVRLDKQLKYADRNSIPYVLIVGPEEIKKGTVVIKDLRTRTQEEVSRDKVVSFLQ